MNKSVKVTSLALLPCFALSIAAFPQVARPASPAIIQWFQHTEQSLMDAVASGDKNIWQKIMDAACIITSEEGEVLNKEDFLKSLHGLPPGLSGEIAVRDLTVQEFPSFAIVRYLADEKETVFRQQLATKYRVTDVYRRDASTWRLISSHTSVVTADPPAQNVSTAAWPALAGSYQLLPDGWIMHVVLRNGKLYGGRDPAKLRPFVPLTPDAFVLTGSLGEWMFVLGPGGKATQILDFRKFEPLVWTRIAGD